MSQLPSRIGPYEIVSLLSDTNDLVYEGIDSRNGRKVAVKTIATAQHVSELSLTERRRRLLREARIAQSLNHPSLVTVLERGEEEKVPYFAMEYLDGCTLEEEIARGGALPLERCLQIVFAVLGGLHCMHQKGMVHRDVKPGNIYLLKDGSVRVADFGMARVPFEADLVTGNSTVGTPEYMSPEQTTASEIDARSDIFSIGAVLYEMLSAKPAFAGDTLHAVAYSVCYKNPPRPEGLSDPLWDVLTRALSKKPQGRFYTAAEMTAALSRIQDLPPVP